MKKSFVPVILFAITFFFLILNSGLKHSIALSSEPGGTIQGKFIWADNTPVTECKVKIFNKIETFRGMNTESFLQSVQNIRISKDAKIEETSVDPEGNDWSYRYHQPANVLYLAGHQEVPEKYELKDNGNIQVKDFELTRLLKPEKPKIVPGKPGIVRFQWPEPKPGMTSKITIENEEYFFKVKYPLKIEKEVSSNSFQITETEPLVPGKHRFRVTIITPSHHKYAQSKWMNFIVPGEVYHLNIKKIKEDSAGTTLRWSGSPAIKFLRIVSQNGSFNEIKGEKVINLPPYGGSQNPNGIFHFYPLNAEQKELIPGWHKFYSQKKLKAASR